MAQVLTEVAELLYQWQDGDQEALNQLRPLLSKQLRDLANTYTKGPDQSWVAADLVNDAFLLLTQKRCIDWRSRRKFFALAATLMRDSLLEEGGEPEVNLGCQRMQISLEETGEYEIDMAVLDKALTELASHDARQAHIAELRFFAGFKTDEIARAMMVSHGMVVHEWQQVCSWFSPLLREPAGLAHA